MDIYPPMDELISYLLFLLISKILFVSRAILVIDSGF